MLEQSWKCSKQCCNNAETLCCAKNRRLESSRVTLPLQVKTCLNTCAGDYTASYPGAFKRIRNRKSRATGADLKFPLRDTPWSFGVAFSTKLETPRNEASDYIIMHYMTKRKVKMAGSAKFFLCVFVDQEAAREITEKRKKERGQYSAILTERAWSITDLL